MNPRHAAALALVGWYLLLPPTTDRGKPLLDAPLSKWEMDRSNDTSKECEAVKAAHTLCALTNGSLLAPDYDGCQNLSDEEWSKPQQPYLNAKCIASDDPRLRP
jgi:hypothetical protein